MKIIEISRGCKDHRFFKKVIKLIEGGVKLKEISWDREIHRFFKWVRN
jgi:hypothetical protein